MPDTTPEPPSAPRDRRTVAAFFDLDKTVIAKASMVAFSGPLHRAGLLPRRMLARAAWGQLVYAHLGASDAKVAKLRDTVLALTRGWDQAEIREIVSDTLVEVVEPIIFDEALDLIREHQAAGHKVFIVSASPHEVVDPLAHYLGVDEVLATRAEVDAQGRYTGRTDLYCYGENKVVAMSSVVGRDNIVLEESYAYGDSASDLPMLNAVGHPRAVNPDRELQRAAKNQSWEILRFTRRVPLRERATMPAPKPAAVGGGAMAFAALIALAARWWLARRRPPLPRQLIHQRALEVISRRHRPPPSRATATWRRLSRGR